MSLKQLRGKVVLVHFYAFQCHNCQANFDVYRRWHDRFGDDVVVVGIQTPETPDERRRDRVAAAVKLDDFKFPVIFDAASEHWKTWGNTMWPTVYVIDKEGYLRRWWQGELRWKGADTDQQLESFIEEGQTEQAMGWSRDAGKFQAIWNILATISVDHDDFTCEAK